MTSRRFSSRASAASLAEAQTRGVLVLCHGLRRWRFICSGFLLPILLATFLPLHLARAEEPPSVAPLEQATPLATPHLDPETEQALQNYAAKKSASTSASAASSDLSVPSLAGKTGQEALDPVDLQKDAQKLHTALGGNTGTGAPEEKPQGLPTGADKTGVSSQAISVPQGSGKIQGMGESFSAQLSTGIATFSVPFAIAPARGAAQPSLGLSYSSSSGHGLAGVGWDLGWPYIARQTDRGLPRFNDQKDWHPEQDHFVFNGGQELVPICTVGADLSCAGALKGVSLPDVSSEAALAGISNDGKPGASDEAMPVWAAGWQYFRPRVEGSFLRFFWSPDHRTWKVQDKGGTVMELGAPTQEPTDLNALEHDPQNPTHIFRWNLSQQYDQEGSEGARPNRVVYRYTQDGGMAYLTDIFSTPPAQDPVAASLSSFAHHTRLTYEKRTDPTLSFRRGWATESALRLARVDVASKPFRSQESPDAPDPLKAPRQMVRRYHLAYDTDSHVSLLASVQVEGRCNDTQAGNHPSEGANGALPDSTGCPRLPAMTFGYQRVTPTKTDGSPGEKTWKEYEGFDERVLSVDGSPKHSLDEALTDLFDVNGDALPDVLVTAPGQYEGEHGLFLNGGSNKAAQFWPSCVMPVLGVQGADASTLLLSNVNVSALDLDGDGIAKLLHMPKNASYAVYSATRQGTCGKQQGWAWKGRKIDSASGLPPQIDFAKDAALTRVLDVNGDGLVDLVRLTGTRLETYLSLGRYPQGDGQFGRGTWTGASSANLSSDPITHCVPWSSGPLSFESPDVRLADINGDGLADLVRVRPGDIRYWPGRGNGLFGTGVLDDCKEGTFGVDRSLPMQDAPFFSDVGGEALRLDDVNGDGLDDLVQVRFDAVDVWLNVDGTGWTKERHILKQAPKTPSVLNRVRLVDINGSGTRDLLWGDGLDYKYIDLLGGKRPWVLTSVANGLGKTTELQFASSVELMLQAAKSGKPWNSTTPMPLHVVVRSIERDNLAVAGRPAGVYTTEYSYRDPVYDGQQREFRGFRHAEARRLGDENSPSSTSASDFLLGECKDEDASDGVNPCAVAERWRDNPREALKGLPVVAETFDDKGVYLSSAHHTYRIRKLYTGRDGRSVVHAFEARTDSFLYDTAPFSAVSNPPVTPLPEVEVQLGEAASEEMGGVRVRSSKGTVQVQSRSYVDVFGNRIVARGEGCVAGCEDGTLWGVTLPGRPDGDPTGWMWRTTETWVPHGDSKRQHGSSDFDARGRPVRSRAFLEGTLPLERFHEAGAAVAPAPTTQAQDTGAVGYVVGETDYDGLGLPSESRSFPAPGEVRRRIISYDSDYADFALKETIFAGLDGTTELTAEVVHYDRGLGAALEVRDLHGETTRVVQDGFGRLFRLFRPQDAPDGSCSVGGRPSVEIEYLLTSEPKGQPFSLLHTKTQRGATPDDDDYQHAWAYVDGMGRTLVTLSEADLAAGDGGAWVVQGLTDYDQKGAAQRAFLPWFWGDAGADPKAYPLSQEPGTLYGRQRYDAFGRQLQTFSLDGAVSLLTKHHALCSEAWDAADLEAGPHQGTFASACKDGHGRAIRATERIRDDNGKLELRHILTDYLPSGEAFRITRQRNDEVATQVTRWMRFDSLGRMVLNVEPNTSAGFVAEPVLDGPVPASLKAWRYAYNFGGDLVGTSDARGCGANYHYDAAGRLVAEDYSPCRADHELYTTPDLLTGTGTEVFTRYDLLDPEATSVGQGFTGSPALLLGRVASVSDRGAKVMNQVDCRGRVQAIAKKVAKPPSVTAGLMTDTTPLSARYAPRWYVKRALYDGADRNVLSTTGATSPELQRAAIQGETSAVTTTFSKRGLVVSVGGSYGPLVTGVIKDADGLTQKLVYGDLAKTETVFSYDQRRRVRTVQTYRGPPSCWKVGQLDDPPPECKGYAAGEFYLSNDPTTFPLLLEDTEFTYDNVDNPIELRDWRLPHEWPAGAKPVSKKAEYDDLYRLKRLEYVYAAGKDGWTSPFAYEDAKATQGGEVGIGEKPPADVLPRQSFDERLLWQTYRYDWLGNSIASEDDAHGFYDRSLGAIKNGTATAGPYQLKEASNETAGKKPREGRLSAKYDEAGYLTDLAVNRSATGLCLPANKPCNHRFRYDWDEVGRLSTARRWDASTAVTANDALPTEAAAVTLRHTYDGGDMRTVKEATSCAGGAVSGLCAPLTTHSVYVFDSLDLRRAYFTAATGEADYEATAETEAAYLVANGVRLARLHHAPTLPVVDGDGLHVLLELADHLGSGAIVLDKATSELAERMTYQGYGSVESDYRPGRWGAFREDYRFTGKEEDSEVGLTYFGFRYLNTALGRWASADPLTVHGAGADPNAYAYVQGEVLKATDPVGLDSAPKQEKADLSGLAVNGVVPDRALVVPGQKGFIGSAGSEYEKFRSLAKVEYIHDASAVPVELKKITILLGDGAKPESKAAREFGYLGALVNGQGQDKNAPGASANGVVGGTNPNGLEGAGWQVSIAAINIFQVAGVIDFAIAKGVGMAMRAIGPLVRELKAIRDIGNLSDDFGREVGREIAGDIRKLQPNREDFLYQKALKERDAVVSEIRKLPRKNQHPVATVVGGYNKETGEIAVGIKRFGGPDAKFCAENLCVNALGGNKDLVVMTPAIRPAKPVGNDVIKVCVNCQIKSGFNRSHFGPGVRFDPLPLRIKFYTLPINAPHNTTWRRLLGI